MHAGDTVFACLSHHTSLSSDTAAEQVAVQLGTYFTSKVVFD